MSSNELKAELDRLYLRKAIVTWTPFLVAWLIFWVSWIAWGLELRESIVAFLLLMIAGYGAAWSHIEKNKGKIWETVKAIARIKAKEGGESTPIFADRLRVDIGRLYQKKTFLSWAPLFLAYFIFDGLWVLYEYTFEFSFGVSVVVLLLGYAIVFKWMKANEIRIETMIMRIDRVEGAEERVEK